ncbi:apolipoprotein A-II [Phaenicophaeus curvirostris]|uniref:apolipoprotein A-II n=1 Tax=Phaenicophaeus curvirostris TaxID=33595 RepID=UPI0037F0DDF5
MKLPLAALVLLLCAGRLGAAMVRREAGAPADPEETMARPFQALTEFFTKELPEKLKVEELRSQAEVYLDRANKQLTPLAQELQSNVLGFFSSLLRLPKGEEQG